MVYPCTVLDGTAMERRSRERSTAVQVAGRGQPNSPPPQLPKAIFVPFPFRDGSPVRMMTWCKHPIIVEILVHSLTCNSVYCLCQSVLNDLLKPPANFDPHARTRISAWVAAPQSSKLEQLHDSKLPNTSSRTTATTTIQQRLERTQSSPQ